MKTTHAMTLLLMTTMARAEALPATHDDARRTLTEARLAQDVGDTDKALALLTTLTANDAIPHELRCEALVRQGALLVAEGRRREGVAFYELAGENCHGSVESMRLLTEAVTGVAQDPARWRGVTEPVSLMVDGTDPEKPEPTIVFGSALPEVLGQEPAPTNATVYTGQPISISMKDAELGEVLRLLHAFTGLTMDFDPAINRRHVTLTLVDVPWDQALDLVLKTNSLRASRTPTGLRIEPLGAPEAQPVDPLRRSIALCLHAYFHDHAKYPVVTGTVPVADIASLLEPVYIRTLPRATADGRPYMYSCADGETYTLEAP